MVVVPPAAASVAPVTAPAADEVLLSILNRCVPAVQASPPVPSATYARHRFPDVVPVTPIDPEPTFCANPWTGVPVVAEPVTETDPPAIELRVFPEPGVTATDTVYADPVGGEVRTKTLTIPELPVIPVNPDDWPADRAVIATPL